ncbi:hypothetical protein GFO_3493 [Christiangramia forsetii KT0803]|uniref:Uncharacterized protein n=1 Tax=Christiangramia forsetii (strain DSM 17595 / CGMCC 1.15422 / KT0803) TaxID=411154 RepID=A0M736_CHRFK|nr:hypothetical protein GFO_3493 [Christiangramia forsetii KT0803]
MSTHLTKKDYLKIFILIIFAIIALEILADWEHFKQGLFGFY